MDELVIGEKKYISSKRAAKATGYAKDYIGQLCREGRVPARLVGRSWYVLESAIHDHRFSDTKGEAFNSEDKSTAPSVIEATWESPRYEASEGNMLPSINRLHEATPPPKTEAAVAAELDVARNLQDSWQAWFDRFEPPVPTKQANQPPREVQIQQSAEIDIPIRTIPAPVRLTATATIPVSSEEETGVLEEVNHPQKGLRIGVVRGLQLSGALVALISMLFALVGTGYFDKYIFSVKQAGLIAGISFYNK